MSTTYATFLTVSPGLEDLLEAEIKRLVSPTKLTRRPGGVELRVSRENLWRLAHEARIPETVRVRVGRFEARTWDALEEGLSRVPFAAYLRREESPKISVTARKSKLIHTKAIEDRVRKALGPRRQAGAATVYLRLSKDRVVVSVDVTGARLHQRSDGGKHVSAAPLRETLAAACLAMTDLPDDALLWDPFCGSGTFLTETLDRLGVQRAGPPRAFAFTDWPSHDTNAYAAWALARDTRPTRPGRVHGSDIDSKAVAAAEHNLSAFDAARWTVGAGDFAEAGKHVPAGAWIVTNLPYGRRLGLAPDLLKRWGAYLRSRRDLGPVFVLTATHDLPARTGLRWERVRELRNGGLRTGFWRYTSPSS